MDLAPLNLDGLRSTADWLGNHLGALLGPYALRLMGALSITLVAWLAARAVRSLVLRVTSQLEARLQQPGLATLLADTAQWAVWLLALPALLGTLELKGLLDPVNAMLSRLMGFLPSLFGAAVVLGIGLLMAGITRRITTGMLQAAGSERLAARLGLGPALGSRSLGGIAGTLVFVLLLLPTLAAALQALGLDSVARPVGQLLDSVIGLVPRLVSAAVVLGLAALIGRALASLVAGVLAGLGANTLPARLGFQHGFNPGGRDMAELGGLAVMTAVMVVALAQASELLGFALLTDAVATLGAVLARVAVALLLLGAGLWLATLAAELVEATGVAHARGWGRLARGTVLFFAGALALRQAGLPAEIVSIAFAAVVGAVAVAVALGAGLAVGLGGRPVARRLLERAAANIAASATDSTTNPTPPSTTTPATTPATTATTPPAAAPDEPPARV